MRNTNFEPRVLDVESLKPFQIRELRGDVLEKLAKRIQEAGYNPARPLTVVQGEDGGYIVADGNHRLEAVKQHGLEKVPCVVYQGGSPYTLAVEGNNDEDTYAPMDLFDWLDVVKSLQELGWSQERIGAEIGWSREKVRNHAKLLESIGTQILVFAKAHQEGRVPKIGTRVPIDLQNGSNGTFNFTEGWFRNSGIYGLNERSQKLFIESFIESKFKTGQKALKTYAEKLKLQEEQHALLDESALKEETKKEVHEKIDESYYLQMEDFKKHLSQLIEANKKYILHGDAIEKLSEVEDGSIDLVITDPPYGIDYVTNFRYGKNDVAEEVANDTPDKAFDLLEATCKILKDKVAANAHLYFFTSFKVEPVFREIISAFFEIKNVLIWVKNNWSMGDLKGNYAEQYEMIIFATNGNKPLNEVDGKQRHTNILNFDRVPNGSLIHSCQKPVDLLEFLIKKSSNKNNMVCDPFMGSGSAIVAAEKLGRTYIGIESEEKFVEYARQRVGKVTQHGD